MKKAGGVQTESLIGTGNEQEELTFFFADEVRGFQNRVLVPLVLEFAASECLSLSFVRSVPCAKSLEDLACGRCFMAIFSSSVSFVPILVAAGAMTISFFFGMELVGEWLVPALRGLQG